MYRDGIQWQWGHGHDWKDHQHMPAWFRSTALGRRLQVSSSLFRAARAHTRRVAWGGKVMTYTSPTRQSHMSKTTKGEKSSRRRAKMDTSTHPLCRMRQRGGRAHRVASNVKRRSSARYLLWPSCIACERGKRGRRLL